VALQYLTEVRSTTCWLAPRFLRVSNYCRLDLFRETLKPPGSRILGKAENVRKKYRRLSRVPPMSVCEMVFHLVLPSLTDSRCMSAPRWSRKANEMCQAEHRLFGWFEKRGRGASDATMTRCRAVGASPFVYPRCSASFPTHHFRRKGCGSEDGFSSSRVIGPVAG
jgi:hypothetical protein